MTFSFNLIDQPWIPCITNDDEFVEWSLYGALIHAHEIREFNGENPLITAALFPMVLALLHRIVEGPATTRDWEHLWNSKAFPKDRIESYFDQWYERFELFHPEYPFYQANDDRVKPKSMIHLVHSIGNTGTLFVHENDATEPKFEPSQSARYLITAQMFRTAGLSGLKQKFTDSPFTRGVLFWALGRNLFETMMLNLFPYPSSFISIARSANDAPIWEQSEPFKQRQYPLGYLDYLTWPSNRILLMPEKIQNRTFVNTMTVAPGLSMAADILSPQKRYTSKEDKKKGKVWSFMYFNAEKALWRDYHSLIMLDNAETVIPPATVEWFNHLASDFFEENSILHLIAIGMLADQAKPIFYRLEKLPLPVSVLRDPYNHSLIAQAIGYADDVSSKLYSALNSLAEQVLMRGGDSKPDSGDKRNLIQQWDVVSFYWERLETHFWNLVINVGQRTPDSMEQWRHILVESAQDALDEANKMSGTNSAALQGQVIAQRVLQSGINKVFK